MRTFKNSEGILVNALHFNIIVAVDLNFGISKNGMIPWKNKADLKFFKEKTDNSTLILGYNTYNIIMNKNPKFFKTRIPIVISKTQINNVITFQTLFECLNSNLLECNEIYICGGKNIYLEALKHNYSKIYLTLIEDDYECDNFILEYKKLLSGAGEAIELSEKTKLFVINNEGCNYSNDAIDNCNDLSN